MTGASDNAVGSVYVAVAANDGGAAAAVGAYAAGTVVVDENLHSTHHKKFGFACNAGFSPCHLS